MVPCRCSAAIPVLAVTATCRPPAFKSLMIRATRWDLPAKQNGRHHSPDIPAGGQHALHAAGIPLDVTAWVMHLCQLAP